MEIVNKKKKITFTHPTDGEFEVNDFGMGVLNHDPDIPGVDLVLVVDIEWDALPDDINLGPICDWSLYVSSPSQLDGLMHCHIDEIEEIQQSCATQLRLDAWYI